MQKSNYKETDLVVCLEWNGKKFTKGKIYTLQKIGNELRVNSNDQKRTSVSDVNTYNGFRKTYKNEEYKYQRKFIRGSIDG